MKSRRKCMIWIVAASASVAALALAGCGGGEERVEAPAQATQEAEPPAPATAAPPAAATETVQAGVITTVAGTGENGFSGDGGPASAARLLLAGTEVFPQGVASDAAGNLYIADTTNNRIRKVDSAGVITTVAGTGEPGFSGDGGPATAAQLSWPAGLELDAAGNLYVADFCNYRVRRIDAAGVITTVAGSRPPAPNALECELGAGGDGSATSALLDRPGGLAFDTAGNLYIAERDNRRIRKVDSAGVITTVAGTGETGFSGDGGPATSAELNYPSGLVVDAAGNLYIADSCNHRIRRVDTAGVITTVAGSGLPAGSLSDCLGGNSFAGDGGPANSALLNNPLDVILDEAGNLYIADSGNHRIRRVDTAGVITTVAGSETEGGAGGLSGEGGPATAAQLCGPSGLTFDAAGNLYFAERCNNRVREVALVAS